MKSLDDWRHERFAAIAPKCEGALAVFTEGQLGICVRVSDVVFDDWGVKFWITPVPVEGNGFLSRSQSSCDLDASWEIFSVGYTDWGASYVAWRVQFEPAVVRRFLARASELAKEGKTMDKAEARLCTHAYESERYEIDPDPKELRDPDWWENVTLLREVE